MNREEHNALDSSTSALQKIYPKGAVMYYYRDNGKELKSAVFLLLGLEIYVHQPKQNAPY